jgi:hypothetical protein
VGSAESMLRQLQYAASVTVWRMAGWPKEAATSKSGNKQVQQLSCCRF